MILLSFDIEEFDTPTEYGATLSTEEQIRLSAGGVRNILNLLDKHPVKATFFCTANFALHRPELIEEMIRKGHEVASHGYYHSSFEVKDLTTSRNVLEELTGRQVYGFRMARMMPVDETEIAQAGYLYNSSLNPTFIPGRYFNLSQPRTSFYKEKVLQVPASVSPLFRIPLFWLSFHNFPSRIYRFLCNRTLKKDGYLNIYFHPWEFIDLTDKSLRLPFIIRNNSGAKMQERLGDFIAFYQKKGERFKTIYDYYTQYKQKTIPVS